MSSNDNWPLQADDLAAFLSLDRTTRLLVLRLLLGPVDADHDTLGSHPDGESLAQWLLTLPIYVATADQADDGLDS